MITSDDIKKLANLARIELSEAEETKLASEIESILGYVSQIKEVSQSGEAKMGEAEGFENSPNRNVMRDDIDPTESGTYSQDLIAEFPNKQGDYLKVKKIL